MHSELRIAAPNRAILLERDAELDEIRALCIDVAGSRGRLALVEGPAGIGKTRLLEEAREQSAARGLMVVSARGGELESDFGFGIVRQLFEPVLSHQSATDRMSLFADAAGLARPVFAAAPDLGGPGIDASHSALHGLYWVVANLAERGPLLVVVDDVQWADAPSLRFLIHLSRRLEGTPVGVLLAIRSGEETAQPELVRSLALEAAPAVIRPQPLSEHGVEALTTDALGPGAGPMLCRACHEATGGNPFLLSELLAQLRAEGVDPGEISPPGIRELAPQRISASLLMRIGRIGPDASALVQAVAVLGPEADLDLVGKLTGIDIPRARPLVAALTDATVLEPGEPLRFVHPIVRSAIYEDLAEAVRTKLHRRAAELLEDRGLGPQAVAPHLLATDPSADMVAVDVLVAAADEARRRGAPDTAVRYLRRALDEPPDEGILAQLLAGLGFAEAELGLASARDRFLAAIDHETDPLIRARLATNLAWATGPDREAQITQLPLYEQIAGDALAHDRELGLMVEAARLWALLLDPELFSEFERSLARLGDIAGDTPAECMLLACQARRLMMSAEGTAAEVAALAERAARSPALTEPGAPEVWLTHVTHALTAAERWDEVERLLSRVIANAERAGSAFGFGIGSSLRGVVRHARGDLVGATADASAALESSGVERFPFMALRPLIDTYADQGLISEGERVLAEHDLSGQIPNERPLTPILIARGRLRVAAGDLLAAGADLELALKRLETGHTAGPAGLDARLALALVLAETGELDRARELSDRALAIGRQWGGQRALGGALRVAGLLRSDPRERLGLLAEAVAAFEKSEALLWRAEALIDFGASLGAAGERAKARSALAQGLDVADRAGAEPLAARAERELARCGGRPRRRALAGIDSLTPSERRVAEMAAEGMTNKAIAQALFVTMRTVEGHLTNAYRKLGVESRRELPPELVNRNRIADR